MFQALTAQSATESASLLTLVFVMLMTFEADYTFFTRGVFFATGS